MSIHETIGAADFARACDLVFPNGMSGDDIAAALGVSRRTLYHYREGKRGAPVTIAGKLLALAHAYRPRREAIETLLEAITSGPDDMAPGVGGDPGV